MRIDYEVAYNLLATVNEELIAKIRQLEEDYNDYRILAQTKIRQLEDETQRLKSEMRWRRDETSI